MIEIKEKDGLIEVYLTSSVKRHEKCGEKLRDLMALYTKEEFLEIFKKVKEMGEDLCSKEKGKVVRTRRKKPTGGKR